MAFDAREADGEELQPSADINVTPFIDVMLVLLIIFMVTAPLLTQGMKVDLPKAAAGASIDSKKTVTITIGPEGTLQVGDEVVPLDGLVARVRAGLADPADPIRLKGDTSTRYGAVIEVVDLLTRNGMTKLQFLTSPQPQK